MEKLQRRAKPQKETIDEVTDSSSASEDAASSSEDSDNNSHKSASGASRSDADDAPEDSSFEADIRSISFGALARAQSSLGKRKRLGSSVAAETSNAAKLTVLRDRLRELKGAGEKGKVERKGGPSFQSTEATGRSSKHAPTEISSKKAVSRKREVVPAIKRDHRDPRFEHLSGQYDEEKVKRNYSFLDSYREDEMKSLRKDIKVTKNEHTKDMLKRSLLSMESKLKAQAAKDKQQELIREHRRKERTLVKQGKKPFYLKEREVKKLALVDRFNSLKSKQLDRVMHRKRKKLASRDMKNMPEPRRAGQS
ncbi:MAG: rRNA biogenesis protein rrp36 [Trizodia sp. TS-e1964]|nr:MAG: rRNA biogenesis protein rrp36 [Trizodia sp. TS-e1964]